VEPLSDGLLLFTTQNFLDKRAINFQREEVFPYIRSIWQSLICSNGVIGLQWALNWISEAFLYDTVGVDVRTLSQRALHYAETEASQGRSTNNNLSKRLDWFLEKLAGQLVNHLCSQAQNRSRGKRRLAETYDALLDLSSEAAALDIDIVEAFGEEFLYANRLTLAIQALTLDTMVHIVFCGFELELYRIEECCLAYWLAVRIIEERLQVLTDTLDRFQQRQQESKGIVAYLQGQIQYNRGLSQASKAMQALFLPHTFVRHPTLPWQPLEEDSHVLADLQTNGRPSNQDGSMQALHKIAFGKRFKWLSGKGKPEGLQTIDSLWNSYQAYTRSRQRKSVSNRRI
jgi:hypothetical protein